MKLEELVTHFPEYQGDARLPAFFSAANAAADMLWEHLITPLIEERDEERKTVIITPNTDADAFGSEIVFSQLQQVVEAFTGGYNRPFAIERPMRLSEDPSKEHSYAAIAARHGAQESVRYLIADAGGADLNLVTEHFKRGAVLDHHPMKGALGEGFINLNPLEHSLTDNDMSGASLSYLVFDAFLDRLYTEKESLGLPKEMVNEMKRIQRNALLAALAGSCADRVAENDLNRLLYEQAKEFHLLKRVPVGIFGIATKPIYKVLAESSIPANLLFPVMTRKRFFKVLATTIGTNGLSPAQQAIGEEIFQKYVKGYESDDQQNPGRDAIFMVQYDGNEPGGNIEAKLRLNRMNAQFLTDKQIADLNKSFRTLGLPGQVLVKELVEDALGRYEVIAQGDAPRITLADFTTFADDIQWTEERYEAAWRALSSELRAMYRERLDEGKGGKYDALFDKEKSIGAKTVSELNKNELSLIKEWWLRNIHAYADPHKRELATALLERPSYIIPDQKGIAQIFTERTVEEIGNLMTAISKIGLRDPFLEAIGPGENGKATAKVREAHQLYKRIVWNGLRRSEESLKEGDSFATKVKDRVYLLDYSFLEGMVGDIVSDHFRPRENGRIPTLRPEDVKGIDLRSMVGVFTGIIANTRKFSEQYVMLFSYVPDRERRDGIKISGRYSELAPDIFGTTHLGEIMLLHGGGGHPQAAATRIPGVELQSFLSDVVTNVDVIQDKYQELTRKIEYLVHQAERRA